MSFHDNEILAASIKIYPRISEVSDFLLWATADSIANLYWYTTCADLEVPPNQMPRLTQVFRIDT